MANSFVRKNKKRLRLGLGLNDIVLISTEKLEADKDTRTAI